MKSGADANLTAEFHPALMLLDDAVNGSQPQPSAFADLFGCEEWLEYATLRLGIHAAAGIGDA